MWRSISTLLVTIASTAVVAYFYGPIYGLMALIASVMLMVLLNCVFPRKKLKHELSVVDSLLLEGAFPCDIHTPDAVMYGMLKVNTPPEFTELIQLCEKNVLQDDLFFKLQCIPEKQGSRYVWTRLESFDVSNHLKREYVENDAALTEFMENTMTLEMDRTKPLWQVVLIENGSGDSAVLLKVHHCVADGMSGNAILMKLLTDARGEPWNIPLTVKTEKKAFISWKLMISAFSKVITLKDSKCDTKSELKPMLRRQSERRLVIAKDIELSLLKCIKNIAKVTVNDVIVSAVSGAYRRYFEIVSEIPLNTNMQVRALIPVGFPRNMSKEVLVNKWTLVSLTLPVNIPSSDPIKRLIASHQACQWMKRSGEAVVQQMVVEMAAAVLPQSFQRNVNGQIAEKHHLVFTNIPGPQEQLYICGEKVTGIIPLFANALTQLCFISYMGKVSASWVVDPETIKDRKLLSELVQVELDALLSALKNSPEHCDSSLGSEKKPLLSDCYEA